MLAPSIGKVIRRKTVVEFDVAGQPDTHVGSLDEVVAQNPLLGKPAGQNPVERPRIVNPFAVVGTFARQVLINVRHRLGVRV